MRNSYGLVVSAALVSLSAVSRVALADPLGAIDSVGPGGVVGWVANPGDPASLAVAVDVVAVNADGSIGAVRTTLGATANGARPDVPAADARVRGTAHGFSVHWDPAPGFYMVRVRTAAGFVPPGEVRIARAITGAPRTDLWFRWMGFVDGMQRAGDYESYPTVMRDGDTYRMWFAGGPADKIYYATSTTSPYAGWTVARGYAPVLTESVSGPDSGLVADPSVVRVPFPDPALPWRFFMSYTGAAHGAGSNNQIFGAISTDGLEWTKMDGSTHTLGIASPLLASERVSAGGYGIGQGSMIFYPQTFTSSTPTPGFVQYYTDTEAHGPSLAVSTDGGWSYQRIATPIPGLGDYTWDMKLHAPTGRTLGMVAIPGAVGADQYQHGAVRAVVAADGLHFSHEVDVPMAVLDPIAAQQCVNNGGLLADPTGVIRGDDTVFYAGTGFGMQPISVDGVWGPTSWDMGAIHVDVRACGPGTADSPCGTPAALASDAGDAPGAADGGTAADALATHDAVTAGDGADGGSTSTGGSGCGCRAAGALRTARAGGVAALVLAGLAIGRGRRRRRA